MIQVSSSSSRQLIQPPRWHRPCPRHRRRLLQAAGPVAVVAVAEEASVGVAAQAPLLTMSHATSNHTATASSMRASCTLDSSNARGCRAHPPAVCIATRLGPSPGRGRKFARLSSSIASAASCWQPDLRGLGEMATDTITDHKYVRPAQNQESELHNSGTNANTYDRSTNSPTCLPTYRPVYLPSGRPTNLPAYQPTTLPTYRRARAGVVTSAGS